MKKEIFIMKLNIYFHKVIYYQKFKLLVYNYTTYDIETYCSIYE